MTKTTTPTNPNVYAALQAARAEYPTVTRSETADAGKFKYKYAPLETIIEALDPVLAKFGLLVVQYPGLVDGQPVLHTELHHAESGTSIKGVYPLVSPVPNDPQKLGGSLTFARRYGYVCIVGLAIEDDDAQNASRPAKKPHKEPHTMTDAEYEQAVKDACDKLGKARTVEGIRAIWKTIHPVIREDTRVIAAGKDRKVHLTGEE